MAKRTLTGYASVTGREYSMFDIFGEYFETVAPGAFERSLKNGPDIVLRMNHIGMPLASTHAGTLDVWEDETGLGFTAQVDTARSDVADLIAAIDAGEVRETSMAGRITRGSWSPDYTEYTIKEFELDRGDVAAVTFGANPHGHVEAASNAKKSSDDAEAIALRLTLEAA